ncbi:Alpha/Beta hydrolase protein [Aspergillus ambiguus]|uniref:putative serine carboxypeptidase n=1 Tax=Aspergillus ambiguus TaxID=176160 RepID=UPI003CCCC39F
MNLAGIYTFFHTLWTIPAIFFHSPVRALPNASQFEVHSLPDSASLPPSWAGRLIVPGTEEGNAMFFWLFRAEDKTYDENLISAVWFNGGPGCSSLIGLTTGNGPVSFSGNSTRLVQNPHSWTKLGHVLYVDQPVGTGYSPASVPYPVKNNDRVASDFSKWLRSLFLTFPHLQKKRVHLIGESYAGIYIPYIAAAIIDSNHKDTSLDINLQSIALGDGTVGNPAAMSAVTIGAYLESQRWLLNIPDDILSVFADADETCGFTHVLEQANHYPPQQDAIQVPGDPEHLNYKRRSFQPRRLGAAINGTCSIQSTTADAVADSILNSSCYGPCATFSTATDYVRAIAAASPHRKCFDVYDIHNDCDTVDPLPLLASYFSRPEVQLALNLPAPSPSPPSTRALNARKDSEDEDDDDDETYSPCNNNNILATLLQAAPPEPPAYTVLPALITTHNISVHVYSGEYDMLLNHIGTELVLQNMTWNGARGFTQKPGRVFFVQDAAPDEATLAAHPCGRIDGSTGPVEAIAACALDPAVAGIWVSERGLTYHLFRGAGHTVFVNKPREMFSYVRDVVLAPVA